MGEYAKRRIDGIEIKIGTCETMMYLRYEDRAKVSKLPNSLDPAEDGGKGLFFRLPFPERTPLRSRPRFAYWRTPPYCSPVLTR